MKAARAPAPRQGGWRPSATLGIQQRQAGAWVAAAAAAAALKRPRHSKQRRRERQRLQPASQRQARPRPATGAGKMQPRSLPLQLMVTGQAATRVTWATTLCCVDMTPGAMSLSCGTQPATGGPWWVLPQPAVALPRPCARNPSASLPSGGPVLGPSWRLASWLLHPPAPSVSPLCVTCHCSAPRPPRPLQATPVDPRCPAGGFPQVLWHGRGSAVGQTGAACYARRAGRVGRDRPGAGGRHSSRRSRWSSCTDAGFLLCPRVWLRPGCQPAMQAAMPLPCRELPGYPRCATDCIALMLGLAWWCQGDGVAQYNCCQAWPPACGWLPLVEQDAWMPFLGNRWHGGFRRRHGSHGAGA